MIDPRLLELAAREVDRGCPTCFIHPHGRDPAALVLLNADEYNRIVSWVPHNRRDGEHTHVEPEMLDDPAVLGFDPDWRVPPGEALRSIFEEHPIAEGRLTELIGPGAVAALLDGSTRIDHQLAFQIAQATNTTAPLWLALDTQYRRPVTRRADG